MPTAVSRAGACIIYSTIITLSALDSILQNSYHSIADVAVASCFGSKFYRPLQPARLYLPFDKTWPQAICFPRAFLSSYEHQNIAVDLNGKRIAFHCSIIRWLPRHCRRSRHLFCIRGQHESSELFLLVLGARWLRNIICRLLRIMSELTLRKQEVPNPKPSRRPNFSFGHAKTGAEF